MMTARSSIRRMACSASYGIQRLVLQLYGPADSLGDDDPVRALKRRYHRAPAEFEGQHINNETA